MLRLACTYRTLGECQQCSVATVLAWLPGMSKKIIWIGMIVGSAIGNMLPLLWGGDAISMTGVLLSGVGGILGIWAGYRLGRNL